MNARLILSAMMAFLVVCMACNRGAKSGTDSALDTISLTDIEPLVHGVDSNGVGLPIFYNMYLSVEMSSLFQAAGAVFEKTLLNSPEKASNYITSSKKALNLGVYAVDLSYAKVSEQLETAGQYFNAMQKMAEELGIPADYFENTAERFDKNINNKDSLIKIANEVYMAADNYLRDNERYGSSAQIILGGWVEAIHIAVDIAGSTRDFDVIERLSDQRVSLSNVISMLDEYASDITIARHLEQLKQLQPVFNEFIVNVDSAFNPETPEGKKVVDGYLKQVNEIGKKIRAIRSEIIA